MKAAVLFELNKPLRIIDIPNLPNLKTGQVKVEMIYSGLCHSQVMEATGGRGEDKYLPHMLGHEGVGIVREVGEGVTKVTSGDVVILGWIRGEGKEAPGGLYDYQGQTINSGGVTTFSEFTIAAENRLVKVPKNLPLDIAVLMGCALPTGAGIVLNELNPEQDKTFAVFGLGGIGLSALIALQLYKPKKIIALDIENEKLALAKELGATDIVNLKEQNPVDAINALVEGGVDYSIEASGKTDVIEQAFLSVRDRGGLCVFASHPPEGELIKIDPLTMHRGKNIRGSWGGGSLPDRDIPKLSDLYFKHRLPLEKILSARYPLVEINQALGDLAERKINRALIDINPSLVKEVSAE
ncbi:zinc-binding dehydrogenase [Thalassotalea marina]|uniref:S-(Hydroxymethyl)glutathione dehydrogenase n=1 Tax=Thalassotalea marina TaxID=1673741 RepID=A0A919BCY8_9GAMM|nr:zinc-binding dehydrogenase [Thalassotalea marina]GHF80528.1 S-(hydroxymethyl)glutathione dehydrogenase [Thalassotalea marina]